MRKIFSLLVALPASTLAFAHEGHGHTEGFTITHYFTEPEHAIPLLLAVVVVLVIARKLVRGSVKK